MLQNILNVKGVQKLNRKDQGSIKGGFNIWPPTEDQCIQCEGEWGAFAFGPGGICTLPHDSPCTANVIDF